jgi:hypothetical protein
LRNQDADQRDLSWPGRSAEVIPVFPLPGALLLPRGQMPLNIFEPRYLAMVDDALRDGHRLIGMIQPDVAHGGNATTAGAVSRSAASAASLSSPNPATAATFSSSPAYRASASCRSSSLTAYRQCRVDYAFVDDFTPRKGEGRSTATPC